MNKFFKCVGNTNIPILNQEDSCSIARHRPRDPVSETVTEARCLKVTGDISTFSMEKVARIISASTKTAG